MLCVLSDKCCPREIELMNVSASIFRIVKTLLNQFNVRQKGIIRMKGNVSLESTQVPFLIG